MAHDVFISHATKDKAISDAVCAALESAGIRCWIAPRDVRPGRSFAGEITRGIQQSKAMVLIFSAHSNNSEQVLREVQLAVTAHLHIVQFRIEDVVLNDDLQYFLGTPHWLDALSPPLENHISRLQSSVQGLLDAPAEESGTTAAPIEKQTAATVAQRSGAPSFEKRDVLPDASQKQEVSTADKVVRPPLNRARKFLFAGAIVALLTAGVLVGWWFEIQQPRRQTEQKEKDQRDNAAARQPEIAEQERLAGERKAKADADAEKERLAAQQRAKEEEAKKKEDSLKAVAAASKEQPYVNSLGMKFVPVPGTEVLFSIWDTRVKDYKVFVEAKNREWPKPSFQQSEEHPAVNVSWEDATAFCEWLAEQERNAGRLNAHQSYRLPTDLEWSAAIGLEKESGSTPADRSLKVKGIYPWGTKWPPPKGVGNYDPSLKVDDYKETSPVGSFEANRYGLYDMGGNVWQWCEDWYDGNHTYRVLRGASWLRFGPGLLLSSYRDTDAPERRRDDNGFRCVLVVESSR
jgi:formylglycine-generating enzyme required for sulfatase activity